MASNEVTDYAIQLRAYLQSAGAPTGQLDQLIAASQQLQSLIDSPDAPVKAVWDAAVKALTDQLAAVENFLAGALLGVLADIPGLKELVADVSQLATEGVHGSLDLGPVHLEVASSILVIQPPKFASQPPAPDFPLADPVPIGPFQVGEIAATMSSPFGGDSLPGGGSIVRLPGDGGYGGTLQLPLGVVEISAAAVLAMIDGQPSFLAILGAEFLPPIQLSFGFSLDRVGGIVGINRRVNTDALRNAVRTGVAGDVLFAVRPPASPLSLVTAADALFPAQLGTSVFGPSLKLSWLSFGSAGSLLGLDLAVIVEIPTGRVAILGVARASIPGLPMVLNLRLDLLGLIDPVASIVSVDASLVDSHVLGIFEIYGDAAMRFSWGSQAYAVVTVGGFFPGFNPEPAQLPALRRVGLSLDSPVPIISVRVEGYFAVTSNTIQFGGSLEVGISAGIEAHGFVRLDAIVQFRPFMFEADIAAGFDVSVDGFSFASVSLEGKISGPGPIVIHGSLSISVFLFSISWDESFTLGSGPSDDLPTPPLLLDVIFEEMSKPEAVTTNSIGDPQVVLVPRPTAGTMAVLPPTGTLQVDQRRAPLTIPVDRVDGRPLSGPQSVGVSTPGVDVTERFSPGTYITLSSSEALTRPPFDTLPAGKVLSLTDPAISAFPSVPDQRKVHQITISYGVDQEERPTNGLIALHAMTAMTLASAKPPALSVGLPPLITATAETWAASSSGTTFASATAAHQFVRYNSGIALASADAADPVDLGAVL